MEAGYFLIAILGCADGSVDCTPVMTMPTHYQSESACTAAAPAALATNNNFDFPSLLAVCRPGSEPTAQRSQQPQGPRIAIASRRG